MRSDSLTLGLLGGVLLAAAFVSVACGPPADDGDHITLRLVTTRPSAPEVWQEAIATFEEANPGIKVELDTTPNNSSDLHAVLTQRLANRDTSVDVFMMDVVWPTEFAMAGYARPLTEQFPIRVRDEFFPSIVDAYTVDDEVYAVPFFMDAGLLYYRADLLEEHGFDPPRTWETLVEQAAAITEASERPGLRGYVGQFKQYEGLICNIMEIVESGGGQVADPAHPRTLTALQWAADNLMPLAPEGVYTYEEQQALDAFRSGNAVFMRNWPYAWKLLNAPDSPMAGRVGMARLPRFSGNEPVATLGGWGFAISAHSRYPQEAWKLIEHMSSAETQRALAAVTGKVPAHRPSFDHHDVRTANQHFPSIRQAIAEAKPRPKSPIWGQMSATLQQFYLQALREPMSDTVREQHAQRTVEQIRDALDRAGVAPAEPHAERPR